MDEEKIQKNNEDLKVLRTYSSDMADAIRENEASVIKIALAEKEKKEREEIIIKAEGTKTSKILFLIGGMILIIIAIFGSYYLIQKKKTKETPEQIINNVDTFISYDSHVYADTTNITNSSELASLLRQQSITKSGLVKAIFLTKNISGANQGLTSKNLLSLIRASAPSVFTRTLGDEYLLGQYNNEIAKTIKKDPSTFIIFQTNDYNQIYASMLEWEKTMLKDLFILFNINIPESNNSIFDKPWQDIIINNRDARVLYNDDGEAILYYIFINKNNLIITDNIDALKEIITRLLIKNTKPL